MGKNIYISGKITGVENFAEIFASKEQELTEQGHNIFNPAKHPDMFSWQQFMELDLKALSFCDSIYMMKGWETSKGAKLELEEAKRLGLEIIYESPEQNIELSNTSSVESLKSLEEIKEKKNEIFSYYKLDKDYVKEFEDYADDPDRDDSDSVLLAKDYIKELQDKLTYFMEIANQKTSQREMNLNSLETNQMENWTSPSLDDENTKALHDTFSIKEAPEPKKKGIGYKVFYLKDGKLYPPMVANPGRSDTPVGKWIKASAGEIAATSKTGRPQIESGGKGTHVGKGLLAYRPGWHLGTVPIAMQFNKENADGIKELFPREFVWAECEYADDVDYQKEAMANGKTKNGAVQHSYAGLQKIPENGSYRYRTNPDPNTEEWIITGAIKVNRILSNREVDEICRKNGREPQKREKTLEEIENIVLKSIKDEVELQKEKFSFKELTNDVMNKLLSEKKLTKSDAFAFTQEMKKEGQLEDVIREKVLENIVERDFLKELFQNTTLSNEKFDEILYRNTNHFNSGFFTESFFTTLNRFVSSGTGIFQSEARERFANKLKESISRNEASIKNYVEQKKLENIDLIPLHDIAERAVDIMSKQSNSHLTAKERNYFQNVMKLSETDINQIERCLGGTDFINGKGKSISTEQARKNYRKAYGERAVEYFCSHLDRSCFHASCSGIYQENGVTVSLDSHRFWDSKSSRPDFRYELSDFDKAVLERKNEIDKSLKLEKNQNIRGL